MLLEPKDYQEALIRHVGRHKAMYGGECAYTNNWRLRLDKWANKHPAIDGSLWGWYEISPIGLHVGHWSKTEDDLADVDINAWNDEAQKIKPY